MAVHAARNRPAYRAPAPRRRLRAAGCIELDIKQRKLQARQFIKELFLLEQARSPVDVQSDALSSSRSTEPPEPSSDPALKELAAQHHGHSTERDTCFPSPSKSHRGRRQSNGHDIPADDGESDSDDEGSNNGEHKRGKLGQDIPRVRWACPFQKKRPIKESAICKRLGWDTVGRVREHLLRHHTLPQQCFRCSTTFTTDAGLDEHQRSDTVCETRPLTRQGMSLSQELRIRDIKPTGTHVERWLAMYRILFPQDEATPSPCQQADPPWYFLEFQPNKRTDSELNDKEAAAAFAREGGVDADSKRMASTAEAEASTESEAEWHVVPQSKQQPSLYRELRDIDVAAWTSVEPQTRASLLIGISRSVDTWLFKSFKDDPSPGIRTYCSYPCHGECDGGPSLNSSFNDSSNGPSKESGQGSKRSRDGGGADGGGAGDGDDHGDDDPDKDPGSSQTKRATLKFACPFFKMRPWLYINQKSCLGGWTTAHRLKEHLYRHHLIQETCNRCYETFDDVEQLISHQRSDMPCKIVDRRPDEGIDEKKLKLLKSKKKLGLTEYEKCRRIYTILWPEINEADLPCPYWDASLLGSPNEPSGADFNNFLREGMSPALRQRLEREFPVTEAISKSRVVETVEGTLHDMYHQFLSQYRSTPGPSSNQDGISTVPSTSQTTEPSSATFPSTSSSDQRRSTSTSRRSGRPQVQPTSVISLPQRPPPLQPALHHRQGQLGINTPQRQPGFNLNFDFGVLGANEVYQFGDASSTNEFNFSVPRAPDIWGEQLSTYDMPDIAGNPMIFGT